MRPDKQQYERIPKYDEWVVGVISNIEYDKEHVKIWQGEKRVVPSVRIVFELDGCKHPHKTSWMAFVYVDRSNLYKNFILELVEGAIPNLDFDLDDLKGMKVKTMWKANGEYDNITMIRPLEGKVKPTPTTDKVANEEPEHDEPEEHEVPF